MKNLLTTSVLLILMGCIIREGDHSREQSGLGKVGKSVAKLADDLAPTMKRLFKSTDNAEEMANLLTAGGKKGKAARRAFKQILQKPMDEAAAATDDLAKSLDHLTNNPSPLARKAYEDAVANLEQKGKIALSTTEQYGDWLGHLNKRGVNTKNLMFSKNPLKAHVEKFMATFNPLLKDQAGISDVWLVFWVTGLSFALAFTFTYIIPAIVVMGQKATTNDGQQEIQEQLKLVEKWQKKTAKKEKGVARKTTSKRSGLAVSMPYEVGNKSRT